jgi:hypothetical protein
MEFDECLCPSPLFFFWPFICTQFWVHKHGEEGAHISRHKCQKRQKYPPPNAEVDQGSKISAKMPHFTIICKYFPSFPYISSFFTLNLRSFCSKYQKPKHRHPKHRNQKHQNQSTESKTSRSKTPTPKTSKSKTPT